MSALQTQRLAYDYIIVGAGSAGCALARTVSDDEAATVLLLEAGAPDTDPDLYVPNRWFDLLGSDYDWNYETVPQEHTKHRRHRWPRGKVLGGTSSINGMMYFRGTRLDYDNWSYQGNLGWDYESVLESFREIETVPGGDERFHGDTGPLRPAPVEELSALSQAFIDAAVEVGQPPNTDFNGPTLEGAGRNALTVYQGRRQSSAAAFLAPILPRSNLTVRTRARVHRVLIRDGRAIGVLLDSGENLEVSPGGEVILCAGAVDSPRLLLLSGIGPASQLRSVGIDVCVDLPAVGANLTDHIMIGVVYDSSRVVEQRDDYNMTDAVLFARSDSRALVPDLQLSMSRSDPYPETGGSRQDRFTILAEVMRPHSRGNLKLRSSDPDDPPLIDPAYLSAPADLRTLMAGIGLARSLAGAQPLSDWVLDEAAPTRERDLEDYVRSAVRTSFHPAGSCRMGLGSDCAVDSDLRVYGLEGLRVADASIMPCIVSCNTNAPSMMIGWHAGKRILHHGSNAANDHGNRHEEQPRPGSVTHDVSRYSPAGG